jgi:hypothetical protein
MSRKLRSLAALATVAVIGAGCLKSVAANGNTRSKGSAPAPGTLPSKRSSRSKGSPPAPGTLPPKRSSRSKGSSLTAQRWPSLSGLRTMRTPNARRTCVTPAM